MCIKLDHHFLSNQWSKYIFSTNFLILFNGFNNFHKLKFFLDEPPVLEELFSDKTVYPGVSVSLKCMATGSPLPQVTWRLDSLPLPEQLRFRVGDYVTRDSRVVSYVNITSK